VGRKSKKGRKKELLEQERKVATLENEKILRNKEKNKRWRRKHITVKETGKS
jgi:hypothetical protein